MAYLILENGLIMSGTWRGGVAQAGEVVFNTSHSGYEEIATDPSYFSQIVVMTAPQQGNYGVADEFWESRNIWIRGFICLDLQKSKRDSSWQERLAKHNVPILTDLDTRTLVLNLREQGTTWGALVPDSNQEVAVAKAKELIKQGQQQSKDWTQIVCRKQAETLMGANSKGPKVAVLDFGTKENILRELLLRSREVKVFPSGARARDIMDWQPDGILLTNGPGDPAEVQAGIETVRQLIGKKFIFGICMGHQVLALALGAKTYKLKYGHRGSNHPIRDMLLNTIYITSQNHGYNVDEKSLPPTTRVTHINLNDGTMAGLYDSTLKCLSVQYHPESHPGPHDAVGLFDFFIRQLK